MTRESAQFEQQVYRLVASIPAGCVASYGQLAVLAGKPGWARHTGRALGHAPEGIPCHRMVNTAGRTAPGWAAQRALLEAEGVTFKQNGCVDMRRHRWKPEIFV